MMNLLLVYLIGCVSIFIILILNLLIRKIIKKYFFPMVITFLILSFIPIINILVLVGCLISSWQKLYRDSKK